jgi:hypothetical protein
MRIAHIAVDFRARHERRHRVDNDNVDAPVSNSKIMERKPPVVESNSTDRSRTVRKP